MVSVPEIPLILFPGMGADERLFAPQRVAFPQLIVPRWITPLPGESLAAYAGRFARHVAPGGPCYVGGASFGGFVAVEVARHLDARACFLIGSARGPDELPLRIRSLRRLRRLLPALPLGLAKTLAGLSLGASGWAMSPAAGRVLRQLADADAAFLRWACGAVLSWEEPASLDVPIHQIHGARDHVLPARRTRADVIVPGAGHVLSLTHTAEVNRFLRGRMI
jgi:pimeloyl-ACP methyl ester carboxylesterase